MTIERLAAIDARDPRITEAVDELQRLITRQYPAATFDVLTGEDPEGVYLRATVDVDDTDAVMDVVIDRLLELEDDEGLPVYVVPVRPLARVAAMLQDGARTHTQPASERPLPL